MHIIDLLEPESISLDVPFTSKKRLFEQLAERLSDSDKQALGVYNSLVVREKLGNTSLGNGVACPHGKFLNNNEIRVHLLRLNNPVDFENIDGVSVQIVVGMVFPKQSTNGHRKFLKNAILMLRQHTLYRDLVHAQSKPQIIEALFNGFKQCNS